MTSTRSLASGILFWVLAVAVAAAHAVVLWQSIAVNRLWEDEAFNLTVPLNLLRGLGYASDGTLSGSVITPFDPRISTGPVVLLPIAAILAFGADLVVGARLVPAGFYVALLVAIVLLGRRTGGRWAALVAFATPLALQTAVVVSPIQGPADILGEVPAAALCAWALVVLHRRPWLAGLLLGLAVQAKYISLLFVPAFAIALWLQTPGMPWLKRVRRAILPAALVLAPSALVELLALISLGPAGFTEHVRQTVAFIRSGGQLYQGTRVSAKLMTLLEHWYLPAWLAGAVAAIAVVASLVAILVVRRDPERLGTLIARDSLASRIELRGIAVVTVAGLAAFIGWWSFAHQTPLWIRHPSPALFALVPVAGALLVLSLRVLGRLPSMIGGLGLTLVLGVQMQAHLAQALTAGWESLDDQRAAAAVVAELDQPRYAAAWGAPVSIAVLADAHVGLWDAGAAVDGWPRLLFEGDPKCRPPSVAVGRYLVCAPDAMSTP